MIRKEKKSSSRSAAAKVSSSMPGMDGASMSGMESSNTPVKSSAKGKRRGKGKVEDSDDEAVDRDGNDNNAVGVFEGIAQAEKAAKAARSADDVVHDVREAMAELMNQKPTIRMHGAQSLLHLMRGTSARVACECLQSSFADQMLTAVSRLLQRQASNTTEEAPLLLELTCMISLMLGGSQDAFFEKFEGPLKKLVEEEAVGDDVQAQALFTLGFICFVSSLDAQTDTWGYVEDLLCDGPDQPDPAPVVQAARTWVLLASIMDDENVLERSQERVYEGMSRLLEEADDTEGRVTAGEGLAYLYEVADRNSADTETAAELSPLICQQPHMAANTLSLLQASAKESSKKISKRDKKEQRAAFRSVEAWIFEGEAPESTVQLLGSSIDVETFQRAFLVEDLKRVIGSGFQGMLKSYDVIMNMLEVEFLEEDKSPRQRVEKGSKEDKRRDKQRKQDRNFAGEADNEGAWYAED